MSPEHLAVRVKLIKRLLATHTRELHIDPALEPSDTDRAMLETELWHLLVSLIEFCDVQKPAIDFDALLSEVHQYFAERRAILTNEIEDNR